MTTQATPDIPERVSRLEGAYEQVTERLRDLTESLQGVSAPRCSAPRINSGSGSLTPK